MSLRVPGERAVSSETTRKRYQLWPGAPEGETRQGTNMASAWRVKKVKFNLSEPCVMSKKLEKEQLVSVCSEEQTRIKVPVQGRR